MRNCARKATEPKLVAFLPNCGPAAVSQPYQRKGDSEHHLATETYPQGLLVRHSPLISNLTFCLSLNGVSHFSTSTTASHEQFRASLPVSSALRHSFHTAADAKGLRIRMSMIVHSPHGRSRRSRFASTVAKPCERSKSLKSHRDVISHGEKGQGQSVQHNCNGPVNRAFTPWGSYGGDTRWAKELSATRGAPNPRYFEVVALDIFLQTAYCLLNLSHIALHFPSGHNALLLEWLDAYCDTHQVYFLRHIALTNNLPKQGLVPSVHMPRSDQVKHAETGKTFLVQRQAVSKYNTLWGHRGSQYPDLDSLQHPFVLASYHQAKLAHMVDKANGDINRLQKGQLLQVSGYHRVRLHYLNPWGKSKHKLGCERKIGLGRPCTLNKVRTVRFRGILIENESIYLNDQDKERLLYLKMEIDVLGKALNFRSFKSLKAKTVLQGNTLLMLAKYMVKGRNCNKVEQEGELGSPQEGPSSKEDQAEHLRDAAKRQERSNASAGKKRSTGSAGHPNDEDDLNDPGKDGDTSRKRSKKRANESGLKFACPFFKHDPERYKTTRSCMGPGWTNVHRVKEHIFRSHCEPPYKCFRCHSAFKTENELSGHQRQAVPCKIYVPESQDRYGLSTINIETERRLRSRKTIKSLTEEEKWFNMYRIIFPDHTPPSSPYHSDNEDMAQLLHQSAGPIFRQDLRARLETVLADSIGDSFSKIIDDIVHQAFASLTSALLNSRDIDGKDTETSKSPLPAETFDNSFSASTSVGNCFDAVSSNAKLPNELESLPQSVNDTALNHSTVADSCHADLFSTTSQPSIDSSSGIKGLSYSLGSGEDTDNEKDSVPISHLDSEDQLKVGTDGPRRTILREPVIPRCPNASQSIVHERPSGYTYGNGCLHGAGDSSHKYRESYQGGDQGNDSGDFIASVFGLWDSSELGDSLSSFWLTESM